MKPNTESEAAAELYALLGEAQEALTAGRMLRVGELITAARLGWADMRERAIGSEADDPLYEYDGTCDWSPE